MRAIQKPALSFWRSVNLTGNQTKELYDKCTG